MSTINKLEKVEKDTLYSIKRFAALYKTLLITNIYIDEEIYDNQIITVVIRMKSKVKGKFNIGFTVLRSNKSTSEEQKGTL